MASSNDLNLAREIEEIGHDLAALPTEVDVLLPMIDRVNVLLSQMEQHPKQQLLDACSIAMKALVEEPLLKHFNNDVKVSVASCLCEVTRIMAPKSAYKDAVMKETFKLIVSSFKDLFDMSSRSFSMRISILGNVAGLRSPCLMLDLECDSLIVEMFQNFLSSIRDYHPEIVFTHMESIMTLVIEESDDVSLELLTPILGVLQKDNEDTQTISRKLGEKVLETCAAKVKPYLLQAIKFLGRPVSQYGAMVAHICEEAGVLEHYDADGPMNQLDEAEEFLDEPVPVITLNEPSALLKMDVQNDSKAQVESQKLNDDRDNDKDSTLVDDDAQINALDSAEDAKSDGTNSGDSESEPLIKIVKRLSGTKRKGMTSTKQDAKSVKYKKENGTIPQSLKKRKVVANKNVQQMTRSIKKGQTENDESEPEGELIKNFRKGKKGSKGKESIDVKEDKPSLKRKIGEAAKRRQKAAIKDDCTEIISVKDRKRAKDSKIKFNKEHTIGKHKLNIEYGENLVDSKIKVWWEDDHEFYEGVIASFDPDNKKHKVLYDDGDIEILNMKNEIWEFVKDGTIKNKQGNMESNDDVLAKT